MKIYYVANARIPTEKAHGLQIMKMCRSFVEAGQEIELIVPRRLNGLKADPFLYYGVKENFSIVRLPCIDLFRFDRFLGNWALWLESLTFFISVRIYLRGKNSSFIYSRDELIGWFFESSKKIVLELHNLPDKIKPYHLRLWSQAKKIIVLTSIVKRKLIEQGMSAEKILVAADAVDLAEFDIDITQTEARKKMSLPLSKKIVLYAGSFYSYDWKGVDVLLGVLPSLSQEAVLVLVGGQAEEIAKIRQNYNAENLIVIASRPHQEMPYYLKSADILVLPNKSGTSASEGYTSPLKLFEYMAAKRAIVASDLPSIREVLNESNAILVKPNDSSLLADGIQKALTDDEMVRRISKQALNDVQAHTWDKRAFKIISFINK